MLIINKIKKTIYFIKYKLNRNSLSSLYYEVLKINKKINKESPYKYSENNEKYIKEKINLILKLIEIVDFYHPNYKNYYKSNNLIKLNDDNFEKNIKELDKRCIIKRIIYANKAKKLINKVKTLIDKKIA